MSKEFDDKSNVNFPLNCGKIEERDENMSLLSSLQKSDKTPFHMPGHKRNPRFEYLLDASSVDMTEIEGTDNLHNASGILKDAMQFAAKVFGSRESRFLVNGSTVGILAGVRALTRRGDKVVVARNCHKSVYNAIEILGLEPHYVLPTFWGRYGFYGSVNPNDVENLLEKTGAKLVIITSPTYEGVLSDIKGIADICRKHGAMLFVDEAHGAHLGFGGFEKSARNLGADLVVNSLHKTLPSLTQTAILHVCSERVNTKRLDESIAMFETSSPSYVLMASIDGAVREIATRPDMLENWSREVESLRRDFGSLERIKLFDKGMLDKSDGNKVFAYDNSKLVFLLVDTNLSGVQFTNELRNKYGIELEMASKNYAIAMTGAGDERATFDALKTSVQQIDKACKNSDIVGSNNICEIFAKIPKTAFNPYQIDSLSVEYANIEQTAGRVSAENIWAYPPGSPIIVKGEIIDKFTIEYLKDLSAFGVSVASSLRGFPRSIAVVKE